MLILKAVVCCLKIRCTISGKVNTLISCKVNLYRPGHGFHCFPVLGWYSSVLDIVFWFPGRQVGFGVHLGQMVDGRTDVPLSGGWGSLISLRKVHTKLVCWCPCDGWTRVVSGHVLSWRTTCNVGIRKIVVDLLVSFSVVYPLKLLPTHIAGIGLRRLGVGFHVADEIVLLGKPFPTFVTHVLLKR